MYLGQDVVTLKEHKGIIFSVKWNDKGTYLLTAAIDQVCAQHSRISNDRELYSRRLRNLVRLQDSIFPLTSNALEL